MTGQKQQELSEMDESFNIEDEIGKQAHVLTDARDRIAASKKHYKGCEGDMIELLKAHNRKSFVYEGRTISITTKQADETISIRTL